jgi:hypothetical protein
MHRYRCHTELASGLAQNGNSSSLRGNDRLGVCGGSVEGIQNSAETASCLTWSTMFAIDLVAAVRDRYWRRKSS